MQFRDNQSLKKFLGNKYFSTILQWILTLAILAWIFIQLKEETLLGQRLINQWSQLLENQMMWWLLFPVAMVFLNWGLEALKWKKLVRRVEPISFENAYKAVLVGQSLAFITPQSIGDYIGRILHLKGRRRREAIGAVMLGRWIQSLITGFFGSLGLIFVLYCHLDLKRSWLILIVCLGIILWIAIFYLLIKRRMSFIRGLTKIIGEKWTKYLAILGNYNLIEINHLLLISTFRYVVFTTQCYLLLLIFGFDLGFITVIAGITWMFLIKSIIPILNIFADLGVREMAVLYFFNYFHAEIAIVLWATALLWVINILFPTLIGLIFIRQLQFIRKT